jgi:hypothetical protein
MKTLSNPRVILPTGFDEQAAAETEADNRFQRAHPEHKIPDESVSRNVEAL